MSSVVRRSLAVVCRFLVGKRILVRPSTLLRAKQDECNGNERLELVSALFSLLFLLRTGKSPANPDAQLDLSLVRRYVHWNLALRQCPFVLRLIGRPRASDFLLCFLWTLCHSRFLQRRHDPPSSPQRHLDPHDLAFSEDEDIPHHSAGGSSPHSLPRHLDRLLVEVSRIRSCLRCADFVDWASARSDAKQRGLSVLGSRFGEQVDTDEDDVAFQRHVAVFVEWGLSVIRQQERTSRKSRRAVTADESTRRLLSVTMSRLRRDVSRALDPIIAEVCDDPLEEDVDLEESAPSELEPLESRIREVSQLFVGLDLDTILCSLPPFSDIDDDDKDSDRSDSRRQQQQQQRQQQRTQFREVIRGSMMTGSSSSRSSEEEEEEEVRVSSEIRRLLVLLKLLKKRLRMFQEKSRSLLERNLVSLGYWYG